MEQPTDFCAFGANPADTTACCRSRVIRSGKLSAVHRRGQAILCDLARDPLQIVSGQQAKQ